MTAIYVTLNEESFLQLYIKWHINKGAENRWPLWKRKNGDHYRTRVALNLFLF